MSDEAILLARRWFEEVWNQRRDETVDELLSPTGICHTDSGPITGVEEFRQQMYRPFLASFPDVKVNVEDVIAQGSQAVVRWTATGTHTGDGLGMKASGKPIQMNGLTWIRVANGKFQEGWQSSNIPEVLRSLGPDGQ